jgi:hypothetical protein
MIVYRRIYKNLRKKWGLNVKEVIIHVSQRVDAVAGVITVIRTVDQETGEIIRSDLTVRQWGNPSEIKEQMLADAINECRENDENYKIFKKGD